MSAALTTTARTALPESGRPLPGCDRSCLRADASIDPQLRRDARRRWIDCPPERAFRVIQQIGGETGWYAFDGLWLLRAWIDGLLGGVGLRRGRRHPDDLRIGDTVDWWRVESIEPDRRLCLRAETKLPGEALLTLEVEPCASGVLVYQTLDFLPSGPLGRLYWTLLRPLHDVVFDRMLRGIAEAAHRESSASRSTRAQGGTG